MNREERKIALAIQKEAIEKEIIYLQEKIDNLTLSKPYHIKKLLISPSTGSVRDICLEFKEKITYYDYHWTSEKGNILEKRHLNHFVFVRQACNATLREIKGVCPSYPIGIGGATYDAYDENGNKHIQNFQDMRIIGNMLIQEYWIWLFCIDGQYYNWKQFDITHHPDSQLEDIIWHRELDKCWQAMKICYPETTLHTISYYIDKYNEQVKKKIYMDVKLEYLPYVESKEEICYTAEELNKRWMQ